MAWSSASRGVSPVVTSYRMLLPLSIRVVMVWHQPDLTALHGFWCGGWTVQQPEHRRIARQDQHGVRGEKAAPPLAVAAGDARAGRRATLWARRPARLRADVAEPRLGGRR